MPSPEPPVSPALDTPADLVAAWRTGDGELRIAMLANLFRIAWSDLAMHLEPRTIGSQSLEDALPKFIQVTRTIDEVGEEVGGEFKPLHKATFGDLKAAIGFKCADVIRAAESLKALSCLSAHRLLEGAEDGDPALPDPG